MKDGHCRNALHAEGNALDWAYERLDGYTLYTTHYPCWQCAQRIVNRGIKRVVYGQDYRNGDDVARMLRLAGVDLMRAGMSELTDEEKDAIFKRAKPEHINRWGRVGTGFVED
jgi:deoxycytidylate deaminase